MVRSKRYNAATPTKIAKLLGTYRWVWNDQIRSDDEEPQIRRSEDYWGSITLQLKTGVKVKDAQFDLVGTFKIFGQSETHTLTGLGEDSGQWNITRVQWGGKALDIQEDGHGLWLSEELDDKGRPFLGMFVNTGDDWYRGNMSWEMLARRQGKKHVEGSRNKWKDLSIEEVERLGLDEPGSDEEEDDDFYGRDEDEDDESTEEVTGDGQNAQPFRH
ncbi:hypothetical protein H0H81_003455 [Sphagnurus paluster]|uniref:Uncharacterized protein n=1 Tax=Sphagnurus paluster TaxID=117069 RepID=A0A9P7KMQ7_9AGAR|nr:hypothetical protein H0H81_003455 [Sphagnurus paluster]